LIILLFQVESENVLKTLTCEGKNEKWKNVEIVFNCVQRNFFDEDSEN